MLPFEVLVIMDLAEENIIFIFYLFRIQKALLVT